jgi:diguanylate cyclase (GGDEF)-like protein
MALFALEVMLYVVGTAFIVLVLSQERAVRVHKDAASTDDLTGVLNRRGFFGAARELAAREAKKRGPVSVLVFDLDHFKRVNDRFGHGIGDETLRVFAATISSNMRASDLVGRLGGEEFVAILPGTVDDAAVVAERVRAAFQAAGATVADFAVGATVSVGIASGEPGAEVSAMLAAADTALYCAKRNGRNRVETVRDPVPAGRSVAPAPRHAGLPPDAVAVPVAVPVAAHVRVA